MQKRWVGKNVDLTQLSDRIEGSFIRKGLRTKKRRLQDNKYNISVFLPISNRVNVRMDVHLLGSSGDLLIETIASERAHDSLMLGFLTSIIGGGNLVLRGVKSEETLRKLEEDFWGEIEDIIALLAGSASAV